MGKKIKTKTKRAFRALLKRWRDAKGMSQAEAAKQLGVPVRTLQNWEIARTTPQGALHDLLRTRMERALERMDGA